ncbi:MAG: 30S ribosomal protein S3 [Candidatus Hydrogenedentota bacterium]
MGQKVPPKIQRLKIIEDWDSKWYANKNIYANYLHEDIRIREWVRKEYGQAGISKIVVQRYPQFIVINIHTARPAILIGRKGAEIERIRGWLTRISGKKSDVNVIEIENPLLDAQLVAESIARALKRKITYRRAMKQAMGLALKAGAHGIKVMCSGRLGGAEIARSVWYREGRVPLHTLRANIDYGFSQCFANYGVIGVKVWIFKGEIIPKKETRAESKEG